MRYSYHLILPVFAAVLGIASTGFAESAGQYVDDTTITTKIKAAVETDSALKNTSVEVTTTQGAVELAGAVTSKAQEKEAIKVAKNTDGVKSVVDHLQVQPSNGG